MLQGPDFVVIPQGTHTVEVKGGTVTVVAARDLTLRQFARGFGPMMRAAGSRRHVRAQAG